MADDAFTLLHPIVADWCRERLVSPTAPQRDALPLGAGRRSFLLSSPTGTGKTLAAFLPLMSRLAERRDADELLARTYGLYISPLRALSYDVEHNLRTPLKEMGLLERPTSERAKRRRGRIRESAVRTAVRTSDTPLEERRLMLARPPHLLLTTPESLAVMLAMDSYRKILRSVETVVVDEVHALAGNKRGAQLSLLLESLEQIALEPFNRVGLSATASPLDRIAQFLVGVGRPCEIVDARGLRSIQLRIEAPFNGAMAPLATVARCASGLTRDVRSALVFTNVRSQAELVGHEMAQLEEVSQHVEVAEPAQPRESTRIGVHHSALERNVRHRIEAALRRGELHTVVCSSSLELGVDIGFVDRVLVVGGARGITATLQRVGRAGHRPGAVADGVVVAQDRDDIIEAAATKRCIADGTIEEIAIPEGPLDVLAQWLVGSVVPRRRLEVSEAIEIARRAFPYRNLEEDDLRACARYLSGHGVGSEKAHVRRIGYDGNALYGLGRDASAAFFENVGTIPDESQTIVRARGGADIGRVEEGFTNELHVGDVLLLAGRTFAIKEVRRAGVIVEPVSAKPTVPQWSSHLKGISPPLAREIDRLRCGVVQRLKTSVLHARRWLRRRYGLRDWEAEHVVTYISQQNAISAIPQLRRPVIEIYRMSGRQTAVFHTGAGRRINETLGRAVGARLFRNARVNTQLTTDDNGFMLTLPSGKTVPDALWASMLCTENFEPDLLEGLQSSHLIKSNFRYVANTGLLVLRRAGGRTLRRRGLSWNAGQILARLKNADPHFVLLRETIRTVTRDLLDAPGAIEYLKAIEGEPRVIHPPAASPFTFGIVTSSFGDSIVLEERATMVEALHERVLALQR
ncbi:MAG: DEAD/DEAH box helicase [Candidatus Eremiobacteraeota bacterium]|nr:DEAD/DEAH box helicase [Candidatus Eremiobacteraeota bacterium]